MIYIDFDEGGCFRAFYDTDKCPEVPEGAILLTPEQVAEIEQDVTLWRLDTATGEVYRLPDCPEKYRRWEGERIVEMTPEEKAALDAAEAERALADKWTSIRQQRNMLLTACDYTQLPDAPRQGEQKTAWAAYRQALRDLPKATEDPDAVVWPERPE